MNSVIAFATLLMLSLNGSVRADGPLSDFHEELKSIALAVNSDPETTWISGLNPRFYNATADTIQASLGGLEVPDESIYPEVVHDVDLEDLPAEFDARTEWSFCADRINTIFDQSTCGSCFAVAPANAASDRICIASGGTLQPDLSVTDVLTCCRNCGSGCQGGYPIASWNYMSRGVVTGGGYESSDTCSPYPFAPCGHHTDAFDPRCSDSVSRTPRCRRTCQDGYPVSYGKDQRFTGRGYRVRGETNMMKELVTHGPFSVMFKVYGDFLTYRSGVYSPKAGRYLGNHVMRVIGYGTDADTGAKFWRIANSWGTTSAEAGYVRFLRGANASGIESSGAAGLPRV